MGQIQNAVNNAMSGTAFLLNQSGITEQMRAKRDFKVKREEAEMQHKERLKGIEQIEKLGELLPNKTSSKNDALSMAKINEMKRYSNETKNLLRNSPDTKDRQLMANVDGILESLVAFRKAEQRTKEREKARAKQNSIRKIQKQAIHERNTI